MADLPKYLGLCETCEHDATCMLRRSPQLQIIQCEEFSIQPVKSEPRENREISSEVEDGSGLGLCANCLNVSTCCFPDARQGVLQCEEYVLDEVGVVPPVRSESSRSAA